MSQIEITVPDNGETNGKSYIVLNSDVPISINGIDYPINWRGHINNEQVLIIQKNSLSWSYDSYDFTGTPNRFSHLQRSIIDAINQYMDNILN